MAQRALLNGIKYQCEINNHGFRQVLVNFPQLDDFLVCTDDDGQMTTVLIPLNKRQITDIDSAQHYIDALADKAVTVTSTAEEVLGECAKRNNALYNFYSVYFTRSKMHNEYQKDFWAVNKESSNIYVFQADMENVYRKYAISSVEVSDAFLKKLAELLKKRDIALMIKDLDYTYSNSKNILFYSINKFDDQVCPNSATPVFDPNTGNCIYEMEIQFSASFADFIAYERFRKDYQQFLFCSELLSFETNGQAIVGWEDEQTPILKDYTMTNSVFWDPIGKEFSHQFQTNDKGNNSYPLDFTCRIRYNVVRGVTEQMKVINDIICEIVELNTRGEIVNEEQLKI